MKDRKKIDYLSGKCGYGGGDNIMINKELFEDDNMFKINSEIKELERKKRNILEELNIFQIFKK